MDDSSDYDLSDLEPVYFHTEVDAPSDVDESISFWDEISFTFGNIYPGINHHKPIRFFENI